MSTVVKKPDSSATLQPPVAAQVPMSGFRRSIDQELYRFHTAPRSGFDTLAYVGLAAAAISVASASAWDAVVGIALLIPCAVVVLGVYAEGVVAPPREEREGLGWKVRDGVLKNSSYALRYLLCLPALLALLYSGSSSGFLVAAAVTLIMVALMKATTFGGFLAMRDFGSLTTTRRAFAALSTGASVLYLGINLVAVPASIAGRQDGLLYVAMGFVLLAVALRFARRKFEINE